MSLPEPRSNDGEFGRDFDDQADSDFGQPSYRKPRAEEWAPHGWRLGKARAVEMRDESRNRHLLSFRCALFDDRGEIQREIAAYILGKEILGSLKVGDAIAIPSAAIGQSGLVRVRRIYNLDTRSYVGPKSYAVAVTVTIFVLLAIGFAILGIFGPSSTRPTNIVGHPISTVAPDNFTNVTPQMPAADMKATDAAVSGGNQTVVVSAPAAFSPSLAAAPIDKKMPKLHLGHP